MQSVILYHREGGVAIWVQVWLKLRMKNIWGVLTRNLHQSYFLIWLCCGVILGVVLGLVFRINYFNSAVWIIVIVFVLIFIMVKPKYMFVCLAFIAGMIMAFCRVALELKDEYGVRQLYGHTVILNGVIKGDPEQDEENVNLRVGSFTIGKDSEKEYSGEIFVTMRKQVDYKRGDRLALKGKIESGFGTYIGYMYRPNLLDLKRPEPGDFVLRVRDWFSERVRSVVKQPESDLGLSYLLGLKGELSDELSENLRMVGLTHIVVASGAHLSILVGIARKIFGRISRFTGVLFSVLFIILFMTMIGFTPSIVRAGAMSILNLIAWYGGRKIEPWRLILMVAAGTLLWNPILIINLGWLLSFASYIGIMLLGPKMVRYFYGDKKPGFVGGTIMATLAATLMTLPVVLYFYGMISLISVVANLLILPTLPYAMGMVFVSGVFAGIEGICQVLGFVTEKLLDYHIAVVEFFGAMRSFVVTIPKYEPKVFLLYGIILTPFLIGLIRRKMIKSREVRNINLE